MVEVDQPAVPQQGLDPGETLERPRPDDGRTVQYFDDEEPEPGPGRRPDNGDDATVEPRVDEILASQHYTFEPDGQ